jgi:hypothetical protein
MMAERPISHQPVRGASFWKMLMTLLRPARPRLRSDIISGSPMQSDASR